MRTTVSSVIVQPVSVDFLVAHPDLFAAHWAEVDGRDDFDLDVRRYRVLEAQGLLLALGVIERDVLRGYSVGVILPHHHRRWLTYYQNEGLYVEPGSRRGGVGLSLVRSTEAHASQRGASVFSWHARRGSSAHELLSKIGYTEREVILQREVP